MTRANSAPPPGLQSNIPDFVFQYSKFRSKSNLIQKPFIYVVFLVILQYDRKHNTYANMGLFQIPNGRLV